MYVCYNAVGIAVRTCQTVEEAQRYFSNKYVGVHFYQQPDDSYNVKKADKVIGSIRMEAKSEAAMGL